VNLDGRVVEEVLQHAPSERIRRIGGKLQAVGR
jgi:hypothetical protein